MIPDTLIFLFFFFNDTATTEIYTLSLHDALPICAGEAMMNRIYAAVTQSPAWSRTILVINFDEWGGFFDHVRSEEHTSELQSQSNLVCRLLLEKKKKKNHDQR